ncbi:DNA-deoxyinosine glycosylase [Flavobacterium sp. DG1-102-2]|uniref:DNA-deoxyinosine glycosylase n=1 Tax=Flavobacterium sp. DG1-102-2 TaxID=3081663 RepID=UPI00294A0BCE|nr:DNA-deoxyinosine glycosylase [Flavobacterium sp. DG1-102-2]MDV6167079.1 DNA-deoxyinosine glycosylase [Flavobacterium sp. DG1-102-2]
MKNAFPPFVNADSKILILGTMPGEKSLDLQEYYGNRGNQFWRLLYAIFQEEITHDYDLKRKFLQRHKLAVWDVLASCEREGSLDSKIKNEVVNDFDAFYKEHPQLRNVLFSSKNAAAYYDKYVGRRQDIFYDVLPSPSGANATKSFSEKLEEWTKKILPLINK